MVDGDRWLEAYLTFEFVRTFSTFMEYLANISYILYGIFVLIDNLIRVRHCQTPSRCRIIWLIQDL